MSDLYHRTKACICGLKPELATFRVSEDSVGIQARCECGRVGDVIEDAYLLTGMAEDAIDAWNRALPKPN